MSDSASLKSVNTQPVQDAGLENDSSEEFSIISDADFFMNDNLLLDTNEDLPIKKPQSAYVIFGKMVRDKAYIHQLL